MTNVELFNNGKGWRIALIVGKLKCTLDRFQAENLVKALQVALLRIEGRET